MCDGLQVARVDTMTNTAQVIDLEMFGDRSNQQLIGVAMDVDPSLCINPEAGVTERVEVPCPQPAIIRLVDVRPEAVFCVHATASRSSIHR